MRMIDEDEVAPKEVKDYIEIRPKATGVRAKDWIPSLSLLGL